MTRKIVDAHHHIWPQRDLPWLLGPMQPRIFGPYQPIRRDYTIEEYLDDIVGLGVEKSVYVQANWAKDRFEDEVAWVSATADRTGWPHAIVGYADFMVEDVRPQLDRLARYERMRGVRMQLHWHDNEMYRFAPRADICRDPVLGRNIARLGAYGWSFDLQVFAPQMADAAALAAAVPDVTFILQHAGMPEDLSDSGWEEWRTGMETLAAQPNVVSKLSAFGTFVHRNDPGLIADTVRRTVGLFGSRRCLFGSNFPIEKLWTDYGSLLRAHLQATRRLDTAAQDDIFWNTAARIYKLGE